MSVDSEQQDVTGRAGAVRDALAERAGESDELALALVELSELLLDEQPLDGVLQRVAELAAAVVPGCTAAGVTLLQDDRWSTAAHSDPLVLAIDQQQYEAGDGPCLDAVRSRTIHRVDVEQAARTWPDFAARARARGIRSFLAAPLVAGSTAVGSLNLYSTQPAAFEPLDDVLVALFCGQASVALSNSRLYAAALSLNEQLREALGSRAVIEQAKGMIMVRHDVGADDAFELLRTWSQQRNVKLRDVAAEVVASVPRQR